MKVALDPYMLRNLPLPQVCEIAARVGYRYIELSPREDFIPFFVHPRADRARVQEFRSALESTGVKLASLCPVYRWSSPDEDERRAAVRYWRRTIEIAVELGCTMINSEFSGRPEQPQASEAQFWRSMDELLPIFEREGISLRLEPHPDDFVETNTGGVNLVRAVNSPNVRYVYCAPHTFHLGDDLPAMLREAAPVLEHVHVADVFNHKASSGLRYIVNPPGSPARVHQHLDIGQGEINWDEFFGTLAEIGFNGLLTSCVFAWEERAINSAEHMLAEITRYAQKYGLTIED